MAQQEMSGKALLNKLYGGLDTMPAEAAMDARDFRRLTDDFLGKPTEATATGQHSATVSRDDDDDDDDDAPSTSRGKMLRVSLLVLCLVGVAGFVTVSALRKPEQQAAALPPPPPVVAPAAEPPPPVQVAEAPPPEPVVLTNPFDRTEKFTFPPGTSKADAREQMANLLMQRAIERGANRPRAKSNKSKLAAEPRKPSSAHGS
jgi:hypothetical protein